MDTPTSAPVADVLARLFDEAQLADEPLEAHFVGEGDERSDMIAELLPALRSQAW
jgi:hypothetical protein